MLAADEEEWAQQGSARDTEMSDAAEEDQTEDLQEEDDADEREPMEDDDEANIEEVFEGRKLSMYL